MLTVTSAFCDANNGGYSGCARTVCDWRAANEYCSKLTYQGKTWRLPTSNELASIGTQISEISIGKGTDGLMLCDHSEGSGSAYCSNTNYCPGGGNGDCYMQYVWSSYTANTDAYAYHLGFNTLNGPNFFNTSYAFSVRCVSDL